MAIILRNSIHEKGELAVWRVDETPEDLLEILKEHKIYAEIPFFRNPKRVSEWLATRALLSELGVKQRIIYNELGKPSLEGENTYLSISHSGPYVAVIVHPEFQVGIDVEITGERIHKVSHKFVNDFERSWISAEHETLLLYIIWGAKECAFKIYSLGSVDFRDDLFVEPITFEERGITKVHFKKDENDCIYQVFFQYLDNLMITYAIAL